MSLSHIPTEYSTAESHTNGAAAANFISVASFTWILCFISFASLLFVSLSQTLAVFVFLVASALPLLFLPTRALRALFGDWLPWLFVALVFLSISWSEEPVLTTKYAIEIALTVAAALILAGVVQPHSLLSAIMVAFLAADVAGLFVGRFAMNAGAMAMIGIFGSKNAFSAIQAYLFLASFWVLLSAKHSIWMRSLALMSVLVCPLLLVAGRSADAVAPLVLVVPITFLLFLTSRWPPLSRILIILTGIFLVILIFGTAFAFRDTLFGQLLIITGKDVTLSGRDYLWLRAGALINQNPLLGTGYGAFWVQGNPYAEEIWAHFQNTGRSGFNFHNQWYDMVIAVGYVGLSVALFIVLIVNIRTVWWIVRNPSAESYFFFGFIWILNMRSFLESESFSLFSIPWMLFVAASYYARKNKKLTS